MSSRVLAIIVGAVILLGAAGAAFIIFSNRNPAPTTPNPPETSTTPDTTSTTTNTEPVASTNSILSADVIEAAESSKKRYTQAVAKISEWALWKPNAQLTGIFMTFDKNLIYDSTNEVYAFDSPDDPNHHLTISVSQPTASMLRALIPIADYQGALLPIRPEFWQSNYVEAVQLADQNGGKEFMATHEITSVDVNLRRAVPNDFLYWIVTYNTKDIDQSLTIKMDAKEKTLVQE